MRKLKRTCEYSIACLMVFCLLLTFNACSDSGVSSRTGDATELSSTRFFDLKSYFEQEAERLSKSSKGIVKKINLDAKEEEQTLAAPDWEQEFRLFKNYDINRIAWVDKYSVDSTLQKNNNLFVTYTAEDEDLRVRELQIRFNQQKELTTIQMKTSTENPLYWLKEELVYYPNQGYSISSRQKVILMDETRTHIRSDFLK